MLSKANPEFTGNPFLILSVVIILVSTLFLLRTLLLLRFLILYIYSGEKQSCSQPNILLKSVQAQASVSRSLERLRGSCLYRWTRLVTNSRITFAQRTSEPSPGTAGAQRTASHVCMFKSGFRRAPRRDNRSMGSPRRALSCRGCAMHAQLPPAAQARPAHGRNPAIVD